MVSRKPNGEYHGEFITGAVGRGRIGRNIDKARRRLERLGYRQVQPAAPAAPDKPSAPAKGRADGRDQPAKPKLPLSTEGPHAEVKKGLQAGAVKALNELGGGCNVTKVAELDNGLKGVWKPASGEKRNLRAGVPTGQFYKREAAASIVADAMGMSDLVPPTVIREHNGEIGSIQQFAEGAVKASKLHDRRGTEFDGDEDARRSAIFDYLIGHSDRHHGNWMLKNGNQKLVLIDNGLAFPTKYNKSDYFNYQFWRRASAKEYTIPTIPDPDGTWNRIEHGLRAHGLEEPAIKATHRRFQTLVERAGEPIASLPAFWTRGKTVKEAIAERDADQRRRLGLILRS
jgi:hypothetical protein